MAEMKKIPIPTVEMISKEMIKPSSPTPSHLRTYQISSLDQFSPSSYIRVVFFYNRPFAGEDAYSGDVIRLLKNSLSESLTHYYPLAGKFVEEHALIDCDDSGAEFTTAVIVGGDDCDFLGEIENPNMGFLEKLVSKEQYLRKPEDLILAVQITRFPRGEIAVGVCISHKISDAATLSSFMKLWSAAARIIISGESSFKDLAALGPILDAPRLWPSVPGLTSPTFKFNEENLIMKKFVFSSSSLARLKSELSAGGGEVVGEGVPTRVTSTMALIWHAIMNSSSSSNHILAFITNIRTRMSPPLSDNSLGNIVKSVTVANGVAPSSTAELRVVLGWINEAMGKVDEKFAKMNIKFLKPLPKSFSDIKLNITLMSSWCRFPFHEVDLGLGRPIWMPCLRQCQTLLFDGPDGGINALIGLNAETMKTFEKNTTLLSFCDGYVTCG